VRHGELGAVGELAAQRALDERVRLHVHAGRRLVQHQNATASQQRPRQAQQLQLAEAERRVALVSVVGVRRDSTASPQCSAVLQLVLQPPGQRGDQLTQVRLLQRLPHRGVVVLAARVHVEPDRSRKSHRFLRKVSLCLSYKDHQE